MPASKSAPSKRPFVLLKTAIVFLLYLTTGWLGLRLNPVSGFASLVWPPTGIALVALALYGQDLWPGIFLGAVAVNLITGASLLPAIGIGVGNTLEPLVAALLMKRTGFRPPLNRLRDVLGLIFFAGLIGPAIAATIGVTSLWAGGIVSLSAYVATWRAWWLGDALGALMIAPLVFTWVGERRKFELRPARILEAVAMFSAFAVIGLLVFGPVLGGPSPEASFVYLMFLPLIWASLRFRLKDTVTGLFILSVIAVVGTVRGYGPFVRGSISESLLFLQLFTWVAAATTLILASSVGELRRAEEELKKSNVGLRREAERLNLEKSRSEALLASIGEGVIAVDQNGRVNSINRAAELMLGLGIDELRGRPVFDLVPLYDEKGNLTAKEQRPLYHSLTTGKTVATSLESDYYYTRKDGRRFPIAMTASAVRPEGDVRAGVLVFRDISEEKEMDRAKTEFVSLASHQLRTPLTTARWYLELLLSSKGKLTADQKTDVEEIHNSMLRMTELVGELLNISRIERGTFSVAREKVDLLEVMKKVLDDYKLQLKEKRIDLTQRLDPQLPMVRTDPQMIRIALEDIVSNAIKYNAEGGQVTIEMAEAESKDGVMLTIGDNGWGIPKHQQDKVFTKFFRAKNVLERDVDGTGLGLYIAKVIVEHSGGKIWFESEEKKGTKFFILLPVS